MRMKMQLPVVLAMVMGGLVSMGLMAPASAAGTTQIGGGAAYDATVCKKPPEGFTSYTSYPGLRLTGSLEGCLYTEVLDFRSTPSGGYIETGHEVFVGSLNGGDDGTFTMNYRFQGKYEGDVEIHGRCQHPIAAGSGTDGFEGATGRLDFKDIIRDTVTYVYRGHIKLG